MSQLRSRWARFAPPSPSAWIGTILLAAFILLALIGRFRGADVNAIDFEPATPPSFRHLFGTDTLGRDLFVRVCAGAWTSLTTSVASIALALVIAVPIGVYTASARGRWPDDLLMRIVEVTQIVPQFILAILVLGLGGKGDQQIGPLTLTLTGRIIGCLALGFIPFFTRIVRNATIAELDEDYVENLRLVGVTRREILFREVLPNITATIGVQALLAFAIAVFAEGGLSFLGMGVAPPTPTLGNLITEAGGELLDGAWWYAVIPGLVLVIGITGANLVGDAVRDRLHDVRTTPLDPHLLDPDLIDPDPVGSDFDPLSDLRQ